MRVTESGSGLTFTAYAGTTGVHLAWDAEDGLRKDLLGFAIRRYGEPYPNGVWLKGGIGFPGQNHTPGSFLDTHLAPIQAFRWGDYTVYPGRDYRYELIPMYAPWDALKPGPSVTVEVTTETPEGESHHVAFNRAVAASQAYGREFGNADPHTNKAAREWLTRGLDTFVEGFLGRAADDTWAVDVVIYEYELQDVRDALKAAKDRGATVRIVYHANPGDDQTKLNEDNLTADGLKDVAKPRVTQNICHDKTVVLSKLEDGERKPQAVLTGSTNWTFNGLYYQANVGHAVDDPDLAGRYLQVFEQLYAGSSQGDMRDWIDANDPIVQPGNGSAAEAAQPPAEVIFSPRSLRSDLTRYVGLIGGATRSLIFVTAFDLNEDVLTALAGEAADAPHILRYGLQNTSSRVTGYDRAHARTFTATGELRSAPEGFIDESRHGQEGNILVHAKIVLMDFDTAHPVLVTGSANYSYSSSYRNDENALIIRDDTRVADIYLCEMFRLFDHYRFRYNWSHPPTDGSTSSPPPETESSADTVTRRTALDDTDGWTARYYDDPEDPRILERTQLARPLSS